MIRIYMNSNEKAKPNVNNLSPSLLQKIKNEVEAAKAAAVKNA